MRKIRWELLVLAVGALSLGAGCPLIPEIKDRIVELAVGGSAAVEFVASGTSSVYAQTNTFDFADIELQQILADADVDLSDVENGDIRLAGVSYRVTVPDPESTRRITSGTIRITRDGDSERPFVTNFTLDPVNGATGYRTATLDTAGVRVINNLLVELLAEAKGGTIASNTGVMYRVNGTSSPDGVDFTWELKVDLTIKGKVKITVVG